MLPVVTNLYEANYMYVKSIYGRFYMENLGLLILMKYLLSEHDR